MAKYVMANISIMNEKVGQDVTEEEFLNKFLSFINNNGWLVSGHTEERNEEDDE